MALTYVAFWVGTRTGSVLCRSASVNSVVSVVCAKYLVQQLSRKYTQRKHTDCLKLPEPGPVQPYPAALILRKSEQKTKTRQSREVKKTKTQKTSKNAAIAINFETTFRRACISNLGLKPIKIGLKCVFDLLLGYYASLPGVLGVN